MVVEVYGKENKKIQTAFATFILLCIIPSFFGAILFLIYREAGGTADVDVVPGLIGEIPLVGSVLGIIYDFYEIISMKNVVQITYHTFLAVFYEALIVSLSIELFDFVRKLMGMSVKIIAKALGVVFGCFLIGFLKMSEQTIFVYLALAVIIVVVLAALYKIFMKNKSFAALAGDMGIQAVRIFVTAVTAVIASMFIASVTLIAAYSVDLKLAVSVLGILATCLAICIVINEVVLG